jgi:hypothetical protein
MQVRNNSPKPPSPLPRTPQPAGPPPPNNPHPTGARIFHASTDTFAGAALGSVVGATASQILHTHCAPLALAGAAAGGLSGALYSERGGHLFHRSTAAVTGASLGAVGGFFALASLAPTGPCNPEILIYGAIGALSGALAGGVLAGLAEKRYFES